MIYWEGVNWKWWGSTNTIRHEQSQIRQGYLNGYWENSSAQNDFINE